MRVPVVYNWTILTGKPSEVPVALGVSGNREAAIEIAETYLLRGEGFLADVSPVRASIEVLTMNQCHEPVGAQLIGRLGRSGTVYWTTVTRGGPVREDKTMKLRIFTEPQQGASYATLRA
ncbi:MAG: hypothetical protein ABSA93_36550, partial [Streptosporangiaceae bacterium]